MSTQTGTFYLGTYGFPIEVDIGTALTGATTVSLVLTKPSGTVTTRALGSSAVTDAALGKVTFLPTQSEVSEAGVYVFSIAVVFTDKQLVSDGTFVIAPGLTASSILVVETGDALVNSNSYATLSEGNAYATKRLYSESWEGATTEDRERALITATRLLDASVLWYGVQVKRGVEQQALGWPRRAGYTDNAWGNPVMIVQYGSYLWPSNSVPRGTKDATCELAIELLKQDRTLDDPTKGIRSLGIGQGAISLTFDPADRKKLITDTVRLLVSPFGVMVGSNHSVNIRRV